MEDNKSYNEDRDSVISYSSVVISSERSRKDMRLNSLTNKSKSASNNGQPLIVKAGNNTDLATAVTEQAQDVNGDQSFNSVHKEPSANDLFLLLKKLLPNNEALKVKKSPEEMVGGPILKYVLVEIEPLFDSIAYQINVSQENGFADKYSNLVHIFSAIEGFVSREVIKKKLSKWFNFNTMLNINSLLKHDSAQVKNLLEVLITFCALSESKNEEYFDIVGTLESDDQTFFLDIVDKNLSLDKQKDPTVKFSVLGGTWSKLNPEILKMRKTLKSKEDDFENERNRLLSLIRDADERMTESKHEVERLTLENTNYRKKNEDLKKELEMIHGSTHVHHDRKYTDEIALSSLKTELEIKDKKIEGLILQLQQEKKSGNEIVDSLKSKISDYESKISELSNRLRDYEVLKSKNKELYLYKERLNDYETRHGSIDEKKKEIEVLSENVEGFKTENEGLKRDIKFLEEKISSMNYVKLEMTNEIESLRSEIVKLKKNVIDAQSNSGSGVVPNVAWIKNVSSLNGDVLNMLLDKEQEEQFNKLEREKEKRYKDIERENKVLTERKKKLEEDLSNREVGQKFNSSENRDYQKDIEKLNDQVDWYRAEMEKLKLERDKMMVERDKLEIALQKTALGIDIVDFDNKKLLNENKFLNQKLVYQSENVLEKTSGNSGGCGKECIIF